jgi:hypothetical protein
VESARDAAVEAWLNAGTIDRAIREALNDEDVVATDAAYSVGYAAVAAAKGAKR